MANQSAALLEDFRQAISGNDDDMDLARAAALLAHIEYPGLDIAPVLGNIEAMAAKLAVRLRRASDLHGQIQALLETALREPKLRGANSESPEEYYDPRNSFLSDVFERGTGIPVSLAVLLMSVGARAGLALAATSMPMHFLVRVLGTPQPLLIDCYDGGRILTEADCRAMIHKISGGRLFYVHSMLEVISNATTLTRMLNNLKMIYLGHSRFERAIDVLDRLIIVNPEQNRLLRERGLVHYRLGHTVHAQRDLEEYLRHEPEPDEASPIRDLLRGI